MQDEPPARNSNMPTTKWTLIARLLDGDESESRAAIDELCRSYHYPLYCQIRRCGFSHHDAEDALHDFMAKLLRNESFKVADAEKGRLRTFLLFALKRFLSNWNRDRSRRREIEFSHDSGAFLFRAGERYSNDIAAKEMSPEFLFDRQWARELMALTVNRLRKRYQEKGREKLFNTLLPVLLSGGSLADHDSEQFAADLDMKPGALRTALHRLLADYREVLQDEVSQTVGNRDQAKEELELLLRAFAK
jgi:DNA-directed RNA polymerase specialized sigma24 family protein